MFIHENPSWPAFSWDRDAILPLQLKAMHMLGHLAGRMEALGFENRLTATLEALTNDVVASWEIEGLRLDTNEVRSSVARKFGVNVPKEVDSSHYVDGVVEMTLDATRNYAKPLTRERLFNWHVALFPNRRSDMTVGAYRSEEMSVVSGTFGRERIHYRAPAPELVEAEMDRFIEWMATPGGEGGILKSAIAHLWFVSIHPFDDGNGRIARAISDMILAELDGREGMHFYSFSRQILSDKNHYYKVLERTQRGSGDITEWLQWYFNAFMGAIDDSNALLSQVLRKAAFWNAHAQSNISERQRVVLNHYLDGYEAKLTAKNWARIAEVSRDTALRDIEALVEQGVLIPTPGRVRDIPYSICYTRKETPSETSLFSNGEITQEGDHSYITALFRDGTQLRDRVGTTDLKRLADGEITLESLLYKHFAYLLD